MQLCDSKNTTSTTTSKRLPCSWQLELQLWSVCLPRYRIAWGNLGQKPGRTGKKGHPSCTLSSTQTLPPPYGLCQNSVRTSQGVFIQSFLLVRLILLLFNEHEMSIMEELGGNAKMNTQKRGETNRNPSLTSSCQMHEDTLPPKRQNTTDQLDHILHQTCKTYH